MPQPLLLLLGAGPGLGLALAHRFGREGFRVALLVPPDAPAEAWETELSRLTPALVQRADLSDPEALAPALGRVAAWGGLPEVLICHAARGARGPLCDQPADELQRDHQVNVIAPLKGLRWARPALRTLLFSGGGLALGPKPGEGAPALGKAAQRSLALSLAQELAPEGIHTALVTIAGWIQPGTAFSPECIAETYWELHQEPREQWRSEVLLKP